MMRITSVMGRCMHVGLLAAALCATSVLADEYDPVNQLLRNGRLSEALVQADLYLATNPRDPQMRFLKGLIEQDAGHDDEAIAIYAGLIEEYPELPEPYNNIAVLYARQNQFERARTALEMATRNSSSYAIAWENLGDVYARLASQSYSQALQLDAGNSTLAPKLALIRQLISASNLSRAAPAPTAPASK